jgi:hypothetical protein
VKTKLEAFATFKFSSFIQRKYFPQKPPSTLIRYVPSWQEFKMFVVVEIGVLSGDRTWLNFFTPQTKTS